MRPARGLSLLTSKRSRCPSSRIRTDPSLFFTTVPWSAMMLTRSFGSRRSSMKIPRISAAGLPFPNPDDEVLVELREASGLQDIGQDVRGDLGTPTVGAPHALRREIKTDKGHQQRHGESGIEKGQKKPDRRQPRRVHHDDLGIGGQLGQGVRDRDHQCNRRDDQDQHGDGHAGDAEEGQDRLTLARHQVDGAQRLRDPDDARQGHDNDRKRRQRRAQNVAVYRSQLPSRRAVSNCTCGTVSNPPPGVNTDFK